MGADQPLKSVILSEALLPLAERRIYAFSGSTGMHGFLPFDSLRVGMTLVEGGGG